MSDHAAEIPVLQQEFDPLGPHVWQAHLSTGRTVHYVAEGNPSWRTLLFFGGAGTSVRAFRLLEFARTLREQLQIRVVSVERNGLGQTPFDRDVGFAEHAADVWALLDTIGVGVVSIVAISGGGPYAAHVAAAQPSRVRSLHLACSVSQRLAGAAPSDVSLETIAADPVAWWRFPDDSSVHRIPGFDDSVIEEATRGRFARGRDMPADGLAQAFELYRSEPLPDLSGVTAGSFLYWGDADRLVPLAHLSNWERALPNVIAARIYPEEGHDVQYRHWDQILADVAFLGERIVVCTNDARTVLATPLRATQALDAAGTLGLCSWSSWPCPKSPHG